MNQYIPKIIGAGVASILMIDAIKAGRERGHAHTKKYLAKELTDMYVSHEVSPIHSPLYEKIKHWVGETALDAKLMPMLHGIKNGVLCSGQEILKYATPLALAAGALFLPTGLAALCAGAIVVGSVLMVLNMGFGLFPKLTKPGE